jgi:hypothetical protein
MKKNWLLLAGLATIALAISGRPTHAASIYVSGFNVGEVYGVGANPNDTVTADVDGAGSNWTGVGYFDGMQTVTQGLPTTPFLSATGSGQTYQLQPFNVGADALRGAGTITVTPGDYTKLYLLGTGGGGNGIANVTLNFSSGPSTTFTNGLANNDWGTAPVGVTPAISAQRTRPGTDGVNGGITSGTWNMYESILSLSATDEGRTLESITITPSGSGTANVYAVNGTLMTPEPASLIALAGLAGMGLIGFAVRRRTRGA